jgi:hypothetical protein
MGQDCLDRSTLKALAAGRCPREELRAVQRHLPTCARCRAAVVASAAGVRGPGDTVLLTRPGQGGAARTGLKVASVLVSLLVVGGAWLYGSAAPAAPPAPSSSGKAPVPEASVSALRADLPSQAPSSAPPAPHTREIVSTLQPAPALPQVQARLLSDPVPATEPAPTLEASVTAPAPAAAATPPARSAPHPHREARREPHPKRPAPAKPGRTSSPSKRAELPDSSEGEGTDRFGLEW